MPAGGDPNELLPYVGQACVVVAGVGVLVLVGLGALIGSLI